MNNKGLSIYGSAGTGATPLVVAITAKNKIAYISITGRINRWNKASSADVESRIREYKDKKITTAEIYLNTEGGNVFEANEILNLIDDNFETITVKVGALCASAGTSFVTKYYTTAKRNSQFMIHKPSAYIEGNEDEIKASLKMLTNVTAQYKSDYAKKMGITLSAVEDMWAKGDYWMTAKEALKKGLIDAIDDKDAPIDASAVAQLTACGAPTIPKIETEHKSKPELMDKMKLIALLGLPADATDAQIEAAVKANAVAAASVDAMKLTAAATEKAQKDAKVIALLDGAEKDKKITPAQRAQYKNLADADFDSTAAVIKGMQPIGSIADQLEGKKGGDLKAAHKDWKYEDYQKNDTKAFEALSEEKQKQLVEASYKDN